MEEDEQERQPSEAFASLSKRSKGHFQKAAELCNECNTQMAIVVLSPTGKPFSFGHSSVDDVVHRYCLEQMTTNTPSVITTVGDSITDEHKHKTQTIEGLKSSLKQIENIRAENKVVDDIQNWIEREYEACDETVEEMELLKYKYLALQEKILKRLRMRSLESPEEGGKDESVGSNNSISSYNGSDDDLDV